MAPRLDGDDLGRSCLRFTIRHHVTNETDSQNAGALDFLQAIYDARNEDLARRLRD